jgi:hypothetical protein
MHSCMDPLTQRQQGTGLNNLQKWRLPVRSRASQVGYPHIKCGPWLTCGLVYDSFGPAQPFETWGRTVDNNKAVAHGSTTLLCLSITGPTGSNCKYYNFDKKSLRMGTAENIRAFGVALTGVRRVIASNLPIDAMRATPAPPTRSVTSKRG